MNRASWTALVVAALFIGCGAGMVAHEVMESDAVAQDEWEGDVYEYEVLYFASGIKAKKFMEGEGLESYGDSGWRLIDFEGSEYGIFVVFERVYE